MGKRLKANMASIAIFLSLVAVIFGAYFHIDTVYAKDEKLKQLEARFEEKQDWDRLKAISERVWYLENKPNKDSIDKKEFNDLKEEKEFIKEKLKGGGKK